MAGLYLDFYLEIEKYLESKNLLIVDVIENDLSVLMILGTY